MGLQEALVNAAKHGNNLDPSKLVLVHFSNTQHRRWWVIADQGGGFEPPTQCDTAPMVNETPHECRECGRGLYILYQVFDQVHWNGDGTKLRLCKDFNPSVTSTMPELTMPELAVPGLAVQ